MDELKDTWGQLNTREEQSAAFSKEEIRNSIRKESTGVLETLTRKVHIKFLFCAGFTLAFIGLIPFIPIQSQILLSILSLGYMAGSILLFKEYKYLKKKSFMDVDLLSGLKIFRKRISEAVRFEELIGLILYPVSGSGGWFIGFSLFGHDTEMDTITWMIFGCTLLILTPLAHFLTRWLNKITFGKLIQQLTENIAELESHEE